MAEVGWFSPGWTGRMIWDRTNWAHISSEVPRLLLGRREGITDQCSCGAQVYHTVDSSYTPDSKN